VFAPEESGAHVVVLDTHTVLMSHAAPLTAQLLRGPPYNLTVVPVNIDEYIKLEGCVTCLSVRVR
jgi:dimethylargininase